MSLMIIIPERTCLPFLSIMTRAFSVRTISALSINHGQGVLGQDDPLRFVPGALDYDHRIADLSCFELWSIREISSSFVQRKQEQVLNTVYNILLGHPAVHIDGIYIRRDFPQNFHKEWIFLKLFT